MHWADVCRAAAVALCLAGPVLATPADPPAYGKVDTFEPGKKYNCVPSADRKSWDCTQTGKVTKDDTPPAPRHDEPAPAATANPQRPPAATPPAPTQTAPASPARTGTLPSYLLAPGHAPQAPAATPAPVASAQPVATPEVHTSTNPPVAPAAAKPVPATPAPVAEAAPKPAPESAKAAPAPPPPAPAPPVAKTEAPVAAPKPAPPAPVRAQALDRSSDFLELSGEQYVIELARGDSRASVAAAHAALHLPHGQAYELHLRQNGSDTWLLVWGSFDDVGAARAARGELPGDAHAGWPRRVAPLQAEVRRAGD
jgi:hypothetical protein